MSQQLPNLKSKNFVYLIISFIALSILVQIGATKNIDEWISTIFSQLGGIYNIDLFIIIVSSIGDLFSMLILGVILTIIRKTRKIGLIFLISIIILSITIMYMKPIIKRESPVENYLPKFQLPEKYTIEKDTMMPIAADLSYPSNHSARTTAFIVILWYWFYFFKSDTTIRRILWIFPILTGFARLHLLQHYFFDMIGGALYGMIIALILCKYLKINEPFNTDRFNK